MADLRNPPYRIEVPYGDTPEQKAVMAAARQQAAIDDEWRLQLIEYIRGLNDRVDTLYTASDSAANVQVPSLTNSWVDYGGGFQGARYWKDLNDVVHLEGLVASGTVGAPIFTLASGFRPANRHLFATNASGAIGRMDVTSAGEVILVSGSVTYTQLSGITFLADG